jgi:hypothetical protein
VINDYTTSSLVFVAGLLMILSLLIEAQNLPSIVASSINMSGSRSNIIMGDLHIIQAIKDALGNNLTGALDELAEAEERLDRAQEQIDKQEQLNNVTGP